MIDLYLFKFGKPNNSTAIPALSSGWKLEGELKASTSVQSPDILLNVDSSVTGYNYAYIPAFARYYWVTDCTWDSGLWSLSLSSDPLGSFRDAIRGSTQYVIRSASASNGYIIDDKYSTIVKAGGVGSQATLPFDRAGSFIVACVGGGGSSTGGVSYYALTVAQMQSLISWLYEDAHYGAEFTESTKFAFNPMQYIISCKWFPYTSFPNYGDEVNIKLGWWDTGIRAHKAADVYSIMGYPGPLTESLVIDLPKHPGGLPYLYGNTFTRMTLQLPGAGEIALDADLYVDRSDITLSGWIDPITGAVSYQVGHSGGNIIVDGQIGVDVQLSQVLSNSVGSTVGAVGAVVSAFTGNWAGAVNAIGTSLSSASPAVSRTGTNGSKLATWILDRVRLFCEFYQQVPKGPGFFGYPLCEVRTLSSLSGYTVCENVQLNLSGATIGECTDIKTTLEGGVILA